MTASIGILLAVATLLVGLAWLGQRRLIYFPFGTPAAPADAGLPGARPVTLATADGLSLGAWYVPPRGAPTGFTVIVFNGNAGHRGFRAPLAARLAGAGIACLLFDYRGYGGNPGSPTAEGLARDARAARAWAAAEPGIDPDRLVYFGESLGAGVAVGLAVEHPPRALVLRSPFTSLADIGRHHYPWLPVGWILEDRYPSLDLIGRVGAPVLVIAGARDSIIPAAHSRRLFDAAAEPKRFVLLEGADHNDFELNAGDELIAAVVEFLSGLR